MGLTTFCNDGLTATFQNTFPAPHPCWTVVNPLSSLIAKAECSSQQPSVKVILPSSSKNTIRIKIPLKHLQNKAAYVKERVKKKLMAIGKCTPCVERQGDNILG